MLIDFTGADRMYIACGYTDLRRGIDGLASLVQQQFSAGPFHQHTVSVLRQTSGSYQSFILGRQWIHTALQAVRIRQFPMATERK